jgi:catecholate siderophore receptor
MAIAAGALPAYAQSGPSPDTVAKSADDNDQPQASGQEQQTERDRVYVLGRRVASSVATVDAEGAPQVVNIIDGETMMEQGVTSLEQALRNVPGITTQIGEGGVMSGDQFFIRGISAKNDVYTDGLRDFGVYTRDSFNYGQVEVFKGPSAAAFGRGAAGGGINTSSKTPFTDTAGSANIALGEGNHTRVTADWNQNFGNGMAGRVAAMYHTAENTGRNVVKSDRWGIAPSIGFGLDGDTSLTIAYLHQYEDKVPDYGLPTVTPTGTTTPVPITDFGLDSKTYVGFVTDTDETTVDTLTIRARHAVNDWLHLTSDLKYGYYQRYSQFTPTSCPAACFAALTDGNAATIPNGSPGGPGPYDQDTRGIQNITTAMITAPLGAMQNELLVGVDASWQHNDRNQYSYASRPTAIPLLDPQSVARPVVNMARSNIRDTTANDVSIFANDRLWFTPELSASVGLRMSWYEVKQNTTTFNTTSCNGLTVTPAQTCYTPVGSKSEYLTPQVGLIWEPAAGQNYWVSYSTSARPPGVSVNNGDTISNPGAGASITASSLDPEESTNLEAGGRVALFDNRLQLQGAIFQTKKDNAKETDPVSGSIVSSGDAQEITGLELGVAGTIVDGWSMNASVTYLDATVSDSLTTFTPVGATTPRSVVGNKLAFTPETAASLWTTYNFSGALLGLEIGGGVTYQDKLYLGTSNLASIPSQTTIDALASYAWDRFRVSLNAYNLSDELYFTQVHGNRVTPGQGRTFIASFGVVY